MYKSNSNNNRSLKIIKNLEGAFIHKFGKYFPQCDYNIDNMDIVPHIECTITTISFKIDNDVNPDHLYNTVPESVAPFKKDHNGNTQGDNNYGCKNKSRCMRKSVTFSIHYEGNNYKLKVFKQRAMQLNGVKSVDGTVISNIIIYIIQAISESCNIQMSPLFNEDGSVKYIIEMSNFKINFKGDGLPMQSKMNKFYKYLVEQQE